MKANRGCQEFVIKGLNQERFFNKLSKKIYVFDICRIEKNKTSFKVDLKNKHLARKEILSSNFEILQENKRGLFSIILDFKRYIGIISAFLLCFFAYFAQFSFVWRVEVNGVNENFQKEIVDYVNGNYHLTKSVDCKDIELNLRDRFENLSFASVAVIGQTLVVNAKEGIQPIEKTGEFEPIILPCDARIIKIKLIQGTCVASEGDTIKGGTVVVQPYIIDSYGNMKSVEARAEVTFETWIEQEEIHCDEQYISARTGKTYVKNELYFWGLKIYEHNGANRFGEYECETKEKYFTKNNLLPFVYKKTTFFETKRVLVKKKYEEVREDKIELAKQKALQKVEESDKIIDERYFENQLNGTHFIRYQITVEREIVFR